MSDHRYSSCQKAWFTAIECEKAKEIIYIDTSAPSRSTQTEEIKVGVLDHNLSNLLGQPTIVQVTLDLLANEKEVYVRTTALGNKPAECVCTFHTQFGGEKANIWWKNEVGMSYELGKPIWMRDGISTDSNSNEFLLRHAIAKDLFKSATHGGFAGYRGYRPNKAEISASQKV